LPYSQYRRSVCQAAGTFLAPGIRWIRLSQRNPLESASVAERHAVAQLCHDAGTALCQTDRNVNDDRLSFILRSPRLVERAVRTAFAASLAVRGVRGASLEPHAFGNLALEALDAELAAERSPLDAVGRHEIQGAALRAAARIGRSALALRLFSLPAARFGRAPAHADALVYDERRRAHVVRIEAFADQAARLAAARRIAAALPREVSPLREPAIHLYSLRDGKLRSFRISGSATGRALSA
jgi:hypothetical protein